MAIKLPKVGALVQVYWMDIVDEVEWMPPAKGQDKQDDHDYIEVTGRFLGSTDDGYIHIAPEVAMKSGAIGRVGIKSSIPLGAVRGILTLPVPDPRKFKKSK